MTTPMLIDTFEPDKAETLLAQSLTVVRMSINKQGLADYWWRAVDDHSIQYERKQAGELLGSINSVELQLRRQYVNADENGLIVEGVLAPAPNGKCAVYFESKDGKYFIRQKFYDTYYAMVVAWFNQLDKCGITVVKTVSLEDTAVTLAAIYKNSLDPEHNTLRRYIKEKIDIKPFNPHVVTLMGISGGGLGEVRARALIERYGTVWEALNADPVALTCIDGIGHGVVTKLFKALGREA